LPVEIAGLELRGGLVSAVVEDDGCAHTKALIAVDGRHIRTADAVVLEVLVEGLDPHGLDALMDEIPDGIVHHRGGDAGVQLEAVCEISGHVEFTTANMDRKTGRLPKRDNARVQAIDNRAERKQVQRLLLRNLKP